MRHFHLWTIGCQMNKAESWHLAGMLAAAGYAESPRLDDADLVVLNTCVVRQSAEDRIVGTLGLLEGIKRRRPAMRIAVTGCFAARDRTALLAKYPHVDLFFGSGEYAAFSEWLDGSQAQDAAGDSRARPCDEVEVRPPAPADDAEDASGVSMYVPIIQGCNNFCTYCIVPYTRGREVSRPPEDVEAEVRQLVSRGTKEVVLLGQNVDSYGHDLPGHPSLAGLLEQLQPLTGLLRIRFLTNHPKDMSPSLIETMARLGKVCEHVDLALQSGDDDILRAMGRGYTVQTFCRLVDDLRGGIPGIAISTDIIVGFPGETDSQFENTYELLERLRLDVVHVAAYSPRPGTAAARRLADSVSEEVKAERLHRIEVLQERVSAEINETYVSHPAEVLVLGRRKGRWFGRTRTDKLVFFDAEDELGGRLVSVHIAQASPWALQGQLVYNSPVTVRRNPSP
ncbi:MAG: tRNA (N6-isopentenyl adenosine(37)-C2)-methylthiotransferase MiaB [Dehalococcoidia bacterium]|jgi:tRNA-2-methylthio-N6-dimethylallyladenosine synthase|nr:tRNA (N6-isopentenyl adenosine(37)-C2)-methylthiotransferase MiaB [Dehalococcoidia bacterium]